MVRRKKIERYLFGLASVCYSGSFAYFVSIKQKKALKKKDAEKLLKGWNVHDAEDVRNLLHWLLDCGRRHDFNQIKKELLFLSEEERRVYIDGADNEEKKADIRLVNAYMNRLPAATIAAYDYSFCILISYGGLILHFLSPEEAHGFQLKAAKRAQEEYKSWQEYIAAFAVGAQFNYKHPNDEIEFMKQYEPTMTRLIASRRSPLRKLKWNTKLPSQDLG